MPKADEKLHSIMKEFVAIPDVHGESSWYDIASHSLSQGKHVIFIGDYVDNRFVDPIDCYKNLLKIITFKKIHMDSVTLLLGNHDLAYVFNQYGTSGFNPGLSLDYLKAFNENWDLFDLAYGHQGKDKYTLFTHAGLTKSHYANIVWDITHESSIRRFFKDEDWEALPLHEVLNRLKNDQNLLWEVGEIRKGHSLSGSTVWADKSELKAEPFEGIDQVVGHTCEQGIEIAKVKNDTLYFIDNWYHSPLMLTL